MLKSAQICFTSGEYIFQLQITPEDWEFTGGLEMFMKELTLFFIRKMFFSCVAHRALVMHHIVIITLIVDLIPSCTESEMH